MTVALRNNNLINIARTIIKFIFIVGCISFILLEIYLLIDLGSYEYIPIYRLVGLSGLFIFFITNIAVLFIIYFLMMKGQVGFVKKKPTLVFLLLFSWLILLVWVLQWMFVEAPPSLALRQSLFFGEGQQQVITNNSELEGFSLYKNTVNDAAKKNLGIMYERIKINRLNHYSDVNVSEVIDSYATKYNVEPEILFYWLYMGSFWGEAVSGKAPFVRDMTSETIRDLFQIHLPYWFVESRLRLYLISSGFLQKIFGEEFGLKLRYAFQKSTYDISAEPYDVYIYTDIYLVMKKYKSEFDDIFIFEDDNQVNSVIRSSFNQIESSTPFDPCFPIYEDTFNSQEYYEKQRSNLVHFARAVFYKLLFDFDFATKVQALSAMNITNNYQASLGVDFWDKLSKNQKLSMIAMLRDVYRPNIGRYSHNLYNLPEFNCSPIEFVTKAALNNKGDLLDSREIWRPKNYKYLWAGATKKLQVLSEVLDVLSGQPLAGIRPSDSIKTSKKILE